MSALFAREFLIGSISQLSPFASNVVITSRYTALNFIPVCFADRRFQNTTRSPCSHDNYFSASDPNSTHPQKNLFEQFHLLPNVYFLLIGVLQAIPAISATRGVPTIYLPLIIILAVSAIRAALEDLRRHSDDHEQNSKLFQAVGIGPTSNAHVSQRETTTPVSETELVTIASSPRGSGVPVSPTESLRTLASGDICVGDIGASFVLHLSCTDSS